MTDSGQEERLHLRNQLGVAIEAWEDFGDLYSQLADIIVELILSPEAKSQFLQLEPNDLRKIVRSRIEQNALD